MHRCIKLDGEFLELDWTFLASSMVGLALTTHYDILMFRLSPKWLPIFGRPYASASFYCWFARTSLHILDKMARFGLLGGTRSLRGGRETGTMHVLDGLLLMLFSEE